MMRVFLLVASAILTFSLSQIAVAETAGERAIAAAKQYAGTTLTIHTEVGLQALGWQQYNAKLWEELTGIKVEITSAPVNEMFVTTVQDFRGPANKDILDVMPSYLPDLVEIGAIDPLDDWMEKYGYGEDYADIAPAYKGWGEYKGKVYGFADDGDVHIMLYRKDLIEENGENKTEFKAQYGYELRAPKTWKEYDDVSQFITDKYGPKMYGAAQPRAKGLALYFWQDMFRDYGGRYFDQETMNCTWNSEAGVKSLTAFVNQRRYMPPGVDAWGFTEAAASFMDGSVAIHYTWPGVGRWAQNIGTDIEAMNWVPKSKVAGKVGYAVPPGGTPELAVGWIISVASKGDNKEAAYLFAQWANSKEASLAKTSLGYSIRDPFRVSHYSDPGFRNLWPNAGEYLDALNEGGANGVQDLTVIQAQKYHDLISNAIQASLGGTDPKAALDKACKSADRVTKKIGVDRQRDVYTQFASQPNAYR